MVYDQPFYHQNTHVNITFLVVDDDPISLSIIPNMLKTLAHKDKSYGEIKVMTAKNSSEAVSTLRGHCNNIDVVITDYHMPGLNGLQLKKIIDEEFGNLPVIVISTDNNKEIEQEVLASGVKSFLRKPISPDDLKVVWEYALDHKMSDPGNTNTDGSNENRMENSTNNLDDRGDSRQVTTKKPKLKWTNALQHKFVRSIEHIGFHKATPKKILAFMKVEGLTRAHIASHLQKYRNHLKRIKVSAMELQMSTRSTTISNFASSSYISYNSNTVQRKNNLFSSQLGYGLGQTSLMMNNNDSIPYMNHIPSYDLSQTDSNLLPMEGSFGFSSGMLPMEGNLGVSNGMLPMEASIGFSSGMLPIEDNLGVSNGMLPFNEERSSTFGTSQAPQVLQASQVPQAPQAPQVPRFGQYGTTNDALGMNSNLSTGYMSSRYAGIRLNENGDLVGCGGIRVNGNCNGPLGEILDATNWNFNDNNNMSNHGSSNPMFPPAFPSFLDNECQSHNNLAAQMDGVVPVLDNPNIYIDHHHGINEGFPDTVNSQYDHNQQYQVNLTGQNIEMPNYDHNQQYQVNVTGENIELPSYDQNQQYQVNVTGENLGLSNNDLLERNAIPAPYPFEDISNWSFDNLVDISNEGMLNSIVAANPEMYVPTHDMNDINQEQDDAEMAELLSTFGQDWEDRGVL